MDGGAICGRDTYLSMDGPVASKHSNQRSLIYAGSMAYLGLTTGRHRHGVGKGGGANTGDGRDGDQRYRERTRNGGGRVGGRRGSREKEKPLVGSPKTQ